MRSGLDRRWMPKMALSASLIHILSADLSIRKMSQFAIVAISLAFLFTPIHSSAQDGQPSVLIVTAHPDDDALFAATVYRFATELGGKVDLALMTDGAGGYRYSTLAEPYYHLKLTDPAVAKEYLPGIRKRELMAGGKIVGVRDYHFFDQPDTGYTQNPDSILSYVWNTTIVEEGLEDIFARHHYDFVLTMLPRSDTHAHHKSATILALRTVSRMPVAERPVVLGAWIGGKDDAAKLEYTTLPGYPITEATTTNPQFFFDRTRPLGLDGRLDYRIVVNWLIAEHKSQGTMQLLMNRGEVESFWIYAVDAPDATQKAARFFEKLNNFSARSN